jgi:hypothetical protein
MPDRIDPHPEPERPERPAPSPPPRAKPNGAAGAPHATPPRRPRRPSVASELIALATTVGLFFKAPDDTAYADVPVGDHVETWPVRSGGFRKWLRARYFHRTGGAPNAEAFGEALNTIEAVASNGSETRPVAVRVGGDGDRVFLFLGDDDWNVAEIAPGGWRIIPYIECPVRFRRAPGMRSLPHPRRGGSVDLLRPFVNGERECDFTLFVAALIGALRERGPYPVLALHGEQGAAKTTTARVFRALVDPNVAPMRSLPKEERDLFIAATNAHVIAIDNVSSLPPWLSDAFCRLATGGGFATRTLYSDADETIFDATRPVVLTGIADFVTRGDLLDRSLIVRLGAIDDEDRRTEVDFWRDFNSVQPLILGALLDAVATALARLPTLRLPRVPRMADFAFWAVAAEPSLGLAPGILASLDANRDAATDVALEADLVAAAVRALVAERRTWAGAAGDLLPVLAEYVPESTRRARGWPAAPNALAARLRRAAPALRRLGIEVHWTTDSVTRTRIVHIEPLRGREGSLGSLGPLAEQKNRPGSMVYTQTSPERSVGEDRSGIARDRSGIARDRSGIARVNPLKDNGFERSEGSERSFPPIFGDDIGDDGEARRDR